MCPPNEPLVVSQRFSSVAKGQAFLKVADKAKIDQQRARGVACAISTGLYHTAKRLAE